MLVLLKAVRALHLVILRDRQTDRQTARAIERERERERESTSGVLVLMTAVNFNGVTPASKSKLGQII